MLATELTLWALVLMYKYMVPDVTSMSDYRAIMTTADRGRISGEVDVPDNKRYEAVSRVRSRIEELAKDTEILREHHPDLYDELHEAVCGEE